MREVQTYSREHFPICGMLEDLTGEVKQAQLEPFPAFIRFSEMLGSSDLLRALDYGSTSLTTGGHARILSQREHAQIRPDMGSIIKANTRTARLMIAQLEAKGDVEQDEVILPVDLGNTGWTQVQFMNFWSLTIGITNLREITGGIPMGYSSLERSIARGLVRDSVDLELMGDKNATLDERRPAYMAFAKSYGDTFKSLTVAPRPVRRLLRLVDTGISLGCDAEKRLADELDIPNFKAAPMAPTTVDEATREMPVLQEDLRIITALNGEVPVAPKGSSLTLVRAA